MSKSSSSALLTNLVHACTLSNQMFTVYDLTLTVRSTGAFLKHEEARRVVHKMYDDGVMDPGYTRSLVNLGGADGPCFVYHHRNDDPYRYNAGSLQTSAAAQTAAQGTTRFSPSSSNTARNSTASGGGTRSNSRASRQANIHERILDFKSRLRLPARQLAQQGFQPGDIVYVCYTAQTGVITYEHLQPTAGQYDLVFLHLVDRYRNVRHAVRIRKAQRYTFQQQQGRLQAIPA